MKLGKQDVFSRVWSVAFPCTLSLTIKKRSTYKTSLTLPFVSVVHLSPSTFLMRGDPRGPDQERTVMLEQARAVEEKAAVWLIMYGNTAVKYSLTHTGNSQICAGPVWEGVDAKEQRHCPDVTQWMPTEQRFFLSIQNHCFLPDVKVSFLIIYRNNIYCTCLLCMFPASISLSQAL